MNMLRVNVKIMGHYDRNKTGFIRAKVCEFKNGGKYLWISQDQYNRALKRLEITAGDHIIFENPETGSFENWWSFEGNGWTFWLSEDFEKIISEKS